jgi:chaperone BCS1
MDNNLPYHIGVLLYGPPGTGKSVIAQAIADYTKSRLLILNGDDIGFISESLDYSSYKPTDDSYTVYLIEDVDCGFYMKDILRPITFNGNLDDDDDDSDDSGRKKRPDGLATILNCLDGIGAPNNVIYVLTTNHIENLDPALIRPGRCDLKIEIGYVNEETFKQFIKFHYGVDINYPIIINRQITFAELQIYVMRGYSVDKLIELMGDKNEDNHNEGDPS